MPDAVTVFLAGLGGVFLGMALLYASIRITALVTDRFGAGDRGAGDKKDG